MYLMVVSFYCNECTTFSIHLRDMNVNCMEFPFDTNCKSSLCNCRYNVATVWTTVNWIGCYNWYEACSAMLGVFICICFISAKFLSFQAFLLVAIFITIFYMQISKLKEFQLLQSITSLGYSRGLLKREGCSPSRDLKIGKTPCLTTTTFKYLFFNESSKTFLSLRLQIR